MKVYLIMLILFNICSFVDILKISLKRKKYIYILLSIFLILLSGFRGEVGTDSRNYIDAFENIKEITIRTIDVKNMYSDKGFIFLTSLIKIIWNNINFYFLLISAMTIVLIVLSLINITNYVVLGMFVYYIRFFFLRDMNQIRAGLAISFLMYSLKFIKDRKISKFLKNNIIAVLLHKSTIIWILMYKISEIKISTKKTIKILLYSLIISCLIYKYQTILNYIFESLGIHKAYTTGEYGTSASLGYKNPIIYFQLIILWTYIILEKYIKEQSYYNLVKNIYTYSVVILLILVPWSSIAGRISTIFATVEIFIIPSYLSAFKNKIAINFILLIILNLMAYYNIFIRLGVEYNYF